MSTRKRRSFKHRLGRISGGWNYRGFCMYRMVRASKLKWVVRAEDGGDWMVARTIAAMRRKLDHHCREEALNGW